MNAKTKPFKANWTESNEYPAVACKDLNQLAWEFLRRNSEYAKHFEQMLPFLETKEFDTGFKKSSESVLDGSRGGAGQLCLTVLTILNKGVN